MFTLTDSDRNADHYACLSTDEKLYDESIKNGSDAIEMDTSEVFMFDGGIKRWRNLSTGEAVGPAILKIQTKPAMIGISVTATMTQSYKRSSEGIQTAITDHEGKAKIEVPTYGVWTVHTDYSNDVDVEVTGAADYDVKVPKKVPKIYGVTWDGSETTTWKRTVDAAEFTSPVPYLAGATNYSSPFDDIMPWAGMVKSERTGGIMVAIPKFYYRLAQNSTGGIDIEISNEHVDGFSVSPAHMDRGDGKGERDVVYVGRYKSVSPDYSSKSGVAPDKFMSIDSMRGTIHSIGKNIWQFDFLTLFTIWLLYLVEFADWNSQAVIGFGYGGNQKNPYVIEPIKTGYTDSMPYHTGTTFSNKEEHGIGGIQYRNIEGLWDNGIETADGCYFKENGMYVTLDANKYADPTNAVLIGKQNFNGVEFPSEFSVSCAAGFPMFYPSKGGGSNDTYSCGAACATDSVKFSTLMIGAFKFYDADDNAEIATGLFSMSEMREDVQNTNVSVRLIELP